MLSNPAALSAAISAVTAAGVAILTARPGTDPSRSAGLVGVLAGAVGATVTYALLDYRMCRMEELGERIADIEQNVLNALIDGGDAPPAALP